MEFIFWLLAAYLAGNFLTAYFFAKIIYKESIFEVGSGNPGARNTGRVYGKSAFFITFIGDALKIFIIVFLAKKFQLSIHMQLGIILTVILGHIYPILFRFRGGKGIACYVVGILLFDPIVFIFFVLAFVILHIFTRSFTIACMLTLLIYPLVFIYYSYDFTSIAILYAISALIIFSHRNNLLRKFSKRSLQK